MRRQKLTGHGFIYYEFKDGYNSECSLQESSAWVKAVANGSQFPEDIVTVETVKSVRTSDTLIKQFATGE